MTERYRCASTSAGADEPLYGTASQVRRWILVEQPGPWGADAVTESRLEPKVAAGMLDVAARVGARLLLVRRHGRYSPAARTCLVAYSTPDGGWLEELIVEEPAELLDLDWTPLREGRSVGGRPVSRPRFLVCTNGRHDPCCAEFGRPLAALLSAAFPERVWESSHFGGDRFAGNVVCLPDGVFYGRVDPRQAAELVHRHDEGRLLLEAWRGRSSSPFGAQAAEYFLRHRLGLDGLRDVLLVDCVREGDRVHVRFSGSAGSWNVIVRLSEAVAARLTCHATSALRPPRFELVAIEPQPA